MRHLFILLAFFSMTTSAIADERILWEMKINGQPVILGFDTGAEAFIIFDRAAKRIGLKWTPPPGNAKPGPGEILVGPSEECRIQFAKVDVKGRIAVAKEPKPLRYKVEGVVIDGVFGWSGMRDKLFRINADERSVTFLKELPEDIDKGWQKWKIVENARILQIHASKDGDDERIVSIDTGDDTGVKLRGKDRHLIDLERGQSNKTITASYIPGYGPEVFDCYAAERIKIGELELKHVPVGIRREGHPKTVAADNTTVGMFALTRIELIVDGKNERVYTRPIKEPAAQYQYNRGGVAFVPKNLQSEYLVAHVAEDGPAHRAGVRDGDVILKLDRLNVAKWRTDPTILPLSRFFEQKAGTKLELTLIRDGKLHWATVELEDFPKPTSTKPSKE